MSHSLHVATLSSLVAMDLVAVDMFFTFHGDLARPWDSRVLRLYGKGFLMLSYPLDKSGDRSHCGSSDVFSLSRDLTRPRD